MTGLERDPVAGFNTISSETVCAEPHCRTNIKMLNTLFVCVLREQLCSSYTQVRFRYTVNASNFQSKTSKPPGKERSTR
jgi:hypothetical protein